MNKKKAIKVLGASAIAASAFVATSPSGADAASAKDVQSLVKKAKDAGTVLKWAISTEGSADGTTRPWAQYNAAKAARDKAVAAINTLPAAQKAGYLADIEQNVNLHINRTMSYIDAITAGEKINVKKAALEAQIAKNLIDDNTEAAYHALSTEIRKQAILLDRVYGQTTRDEIRENYKKAAETVRDSVKYEVSAKIELDLAKKAIAANDTATADKHLAEAAKYMKDVKNETMKSALVKAMDEVQAQMTPEVKSVSTINATQVEVKFNKAVDPASLFTNGKDGAFKANTVSLTSLDSIAPGTLTGTLSEDGKTLTVTAVNPLSKRYDVVVDNVTTKEGKAFPKYAKMSTFEADVTAPSVVSATKVSANSVKVIFSEPIKSLGTVSFKLADGTAVAGSGNGVTYTFVQGAKEVTFNLGSDIAVNKEVIATFIGAQDQAGNLISPNPATVSLVKGDKDGVAPTVSSIAQTGAKTFAIKFSEQLFAKPVVKIGGTPVTTSDVVQDTTDPTVYNVTSASVLDGATTIAVESFTDLSGEVGTNLSKVVTFAKETAAPKMVSSAVVADATNKKEYLEITFDKDVVLGTPATVDATSGSFVKDYVTTTIANGDINPLAVAYKTATNKKVIRVELDTFLGGKDVKGANYNLNLAFAGVTSAANVTADTAQVTFTRGEDGIAANTDIVGVTSVAQDALNNNKVLVTFDKAVDGESATNPSNYNIDGAIVESVTLNAVSGSTQVATLNLKANSNGFTGTRNINISNVKALGSTKTMNPYFTNTVSLKENVAPVVTSAKLTATNQITLTFSEAVTDSTAKDFEVLIGGKSQGSVEEVSAGSGSANTTVVMTIAGIDATELAQGISLKGLTSLDIVDAAGNKLSVPANITVSN